jgi:hypothetical protein
MPELRPKHTKIDNVLVQTQQGSSPRGARVVLDLAFGRHFDESIRGNLFAAGKTVCDFTKKIFSAGRSDHTRDSCTAGDGAIDSSTFTRNLSAPIVRLAIAEPAHSGVLTGDAF